MKRSGPNRFLTSLPDLLATARDGELGRSARARSKGLQASRCGNLITGLAARLCTRRDPRGLPLLAVSDAIRR